MIDIDASLLSCEQNPSFWVYFNDPGNDGDKIGFEVKAAPQKQRKLVDRSVRISSNFRGEDTGEMQIAADWTGLAIALTEYLIGWDGFSGEFSKEKVKLWFEKYPSYAIAFAQGFKSVLDEYETALIKRKDAELKN